MSQENNNLIDVDGGLARTRGNKKLYVRMLGMFLSGQEFDHFEAAITEGDLGKAGDAAHTLKGVTGNLSLTALYEQSAALMQKLRQDELDEALIAAYHDTYALTRAAVADTIARLSAE